MNETGVTGGFIGPRKTCSTQWPLFRGSFVKQTHRRVVVLSTLVTILMLTSALLLALAPAPLSPDSSSNLFAADSPDSMDVVFRTGVQARPGRWKYIYIHHSRTPNGSALTLAQQPEGLRDHFVIGNGDGAVDGEIQIGPRWTRQDAALPPVGASFDKRHESDIISICLVGDFDKSVPTPMQLRRLSQLVGTLQGRLAIASKDVLMQDLPHVIAGTGRYFPATAFREQLLP
jgi:N-acetylmuramoyl-L-alanine amidase